jgi:hypothetical protein
LFLSSKSSFDLSSRFGFLNEFLSQFVRIKFVFSKILSLGEAASFRMKALHKFILILLLLHAKCELQTAELFKRITSYSLENKEKMKEVFLSKIIEETIIGSVMLCTENGMEFLRIESQEELMKVFRALKLHWLEFDDELFVDGVKSSKKWKFLINGDEVDSRVLYFLEDGDNYIDGDFVKVFKNGTNLALGVFNVDSAREKRKFLCEKIKISPQAGEMKTLEETGPLKVEVLSRMFEKIGSYESFSNSKFTKSTFFINRNAGLSHPKASRFCQNFGMKLVHIDCHEKFSALVSLLTKPGIGIDTHFMIGDLRESFLEVHAWANTINLSGNQGRKEQCVSIFLNRLNEKGRIVYFDCNDDYKYQSFICEKNQYKDSWTEEYPFEAPKVSKFKTTGMKFLGSIQNCKKFIFKT